VIAAALDALPLAHLASSLGVHTYDVVDFAIGSRRVRVLSNDPAVVGYATAVLRSARVLSQVDGVEQPPDAVCLAVLVTRPLLDRLIAVGDQAAEPVTLHGGRSGLASTLSAADGFRVVRMPGRDDRFVIDAGTRTVLYGGCRDDSRCIREPAHLVEALLTAVVAQDGPVVAGAATGSSTGAALLLDTGVGTAGAVLPLLHEHGAALLSWSSVQLTADPHVPDRVRLRGLPSSCDVPVPVLRRIPALGRHVCLADHPALAVTSAQDTDAWGDAVEFTADEIAEALGCRMVEQAPLVLIVGPRQVSQEAALLRAVEVAAARYPAWHGIGATPALPTDAFFSHGLAVHPWVAVDGYDAAAARAVAGELRHRRLTEAVPDLPDARHWPRATMTGRWVAVMEHRRLSRGMKLERWQTRAVSAGSVHELMTTPAPPPSGSDCIDEVAYLGFAEFTGGLLAVGDAVHEADGTLLGHVLGFDDTHLPNHMNVILLSEDRRTGRQRGLPAGGGLQVVSPADGRTARGGEPR
jgi:hypothetical protein